MTGVAVMPPPPGRRLSVFVPGPSEILSLNASRREISRRSGTPLAIVKHDKRA